MKPVKSPPSGRYPEEIDSFDSGKMCRLKPADRRDFATTEFRNANESSWMKL
jgi:hypothetical protein